MSSSAATVASQVLSYFGAVFWSIQLLPQIFLNYRRGHTIGLHQSMMLWWSLAGLPLALHNILGGQPVALQVQAEILTGLSLITWAQVMYYSHSWSKWRCALSLSAWLLAFAIVQGATIAGIRYGTATGEAPDALIKTLAILSAAALSAGVLRHYLDIYEERTVRGISWIFVFLDAMGDLTSLLSIVLVRPLDVYATVIYASELSLWLGMAFIGVAFTVRDRRRRVRQQSKVAHVEDADRRDQGPLPQADVSPDVQHRTSPPSPGVRLSSIGTSVFTRVLHKRHQGRGTRVQDTRSPEYLDRAS